VALSPDDSFLLRIEIIVIGSVVQITKDQSGIVPAKVQVIVGRQLLVGGVDVREGADEDAEENLKKCFLNLQCVKGLLPT